MKKNIVFLSILILLAQFFCSWSAVSSFQYQQIRDPSGVLLYEYPLQEWTGSVDLSLADPQWKTQMKDLLDGLGPDEYLFFLQTQQTDPVTYDTVCFMKTPDDRVPVYRNQPGQECFLVSLESSYSTDRENCPPSGLLGLMDPSYYGQEWNHITFVLADNLISRKEGLFDLRLLCSASSKTPERLREIFAGAFIRGAGEAGLNRETSDAFVLPAVSWHLPLLYAVCLLVLMMVLYRKRIRACMILKINGCSDLKIFLIEFGRFFTTLGLLPSGITLLLFGLFGSKFGFYSSILLHQLLWILQFHYAAMLAGGMLLLAGIHFEKKQTSLKYVQRGNDSIVFAFALLVLALVLSVESFSSNFAVLRMNAANLLELKNNPSQYAGYVSLLGPQSDYGLQTGMDAEASWAQFLEEHNGILQDFSQVPNANSEIAYPSVRVNPRYLEAYAITDSDGNRVDPAKINDPVLLIPEKYRNDSGLEEQLSVIFPVPNPQIIFIQNGLTVKSHSPMASVLSPLVIQDAIIGVYPIWLLTQATAMTFSCCPLAARKRNWLISSFMSRLRSASFCS